MRPLFAYLRALPLPTSVFAATEDWGDSGALASRVDRAAAELVASLETGMRESLLGTSRSLYKRTFDGSASDAERGADDIDFDSDMMRLATGGSAEA